MSEVSELNRESLLNRVLRDNALASLMVILTVMGFLNGLVIGLGVGRFESAAEGMKEDFSTLKSQYEIDQIFKQRLIVTLEAHNIPVPEVPKQEEE